MPEREPFEFRVWWSRGRKLPTEGSFPACEIVVLAFVEDDHASVFVLKCYWEIGRAHV